MTTRLLRHPEAVFVFVETSVWARTPPAATKAARPGHLWSFQREILSRYSSCGDGSGRYGRLHVYPRPDLMSDRERSAPGPGWTWHSAMIHLVVSVCERTGPGLLL